MEGGGIRPKGRIVRQNKPAEHRTHGANLQARTESETGRNGKRWAYHGESEKTEKNQKRQGPKSPGGFARTKNQKKKKKRGKWRRARLTEKKKWRGESWRKKSRRSCEGERPSWTEKNLSEGGCFAEAGRRSSEEKGYQPLKQPKRKKN